MILPWQHGLTNTSPGDRSCDCWHSGLRGGRRTTQELCIHALQIRAYAAGTSHDCRLARESRSASFDRSSWLTGTLM